MRSPAELTALFRQQSLKVTPQREAVFRALHGNAAHPTADAVHATVIEAMPTVSLRTVYQVLNDLALMGEIRSLDLGTGAARFDPNVGAHQHLVCSGCGEVRDVVIDDSALSLPAGADHGFTVDQAEVVFRGRCDECAAATAPEIG